MMTLLDLDCKTVCTLSISDSGTAAAGTNEGIRDEPTIKLETRPRSSWLRRPRPKPCDNEEEDSMSCGDGIMKASLALSSALAVFVLPEGLEDWFVEGALLLPALPAVEAAATAAAAAATNEDEDNVLEEGLKDPELD